MPRRSPSALMFISASGRSSSASRRACVSDRNSGASTGAAALINWILPFILLILRLLDRARLWTTNLPGSPSLSTTASTWGRCTCAAPGTPPSTCTCAAFADAVATAVRFLVLTCDVTHIVLGGGVAQVGLPLRDAVADAIARQTAG